MSAASIGRLTSSGRRMSFDVTTKASYITYFDNAEDFQCSNKKTKKCDGLTESQWAAIILAAKALNQKNKIDPRLDQQYNSNVGCSTCVDFRNYIPKNSKFSVSDVYNFFIVANLTAKNYNPHVTLAELQKDLRNDFIKKKQDDKFFDSMYIMRNGFPKSHTIPPYTIVTTSNVGPQYLRPPIKDFWSQQSEPAVKTDFGFCLLSFSKITPNSNQIILRNRYSSHTVSDSGHKTPCRAPAGCPLHHSTPSERRSHPAKQDRRRLPVPVPGCRSDWP